MTLNLPDLVYAFNQTTSEKGEGDLYFFYAMMYVMHEYAHYGDKKTNNGHYSGESPRESGDLEKSSDKTEPIQMAESPGRHRGADVDNVILFNGYLKKNPISDGLIPGPLLEESRKAILDSQRYKKWLLKKR